MVTFIKSLLFCIQSFSNAVKGTFNLFFFVSNTIPLIGCLLLIKSQHMTSKDEFLLISIQNNLASVSGSIVDSLVTDLSKLLKPSWAMLLVKMDWKLSGLTIIPLTLNNPMKFLHTFCVISTSFSRSLFSIYYFQYNVCWFL